MTEKEYDNYEQVRDALETMTYVWENCKNYAWSKSDWEQHYQAATKLEELYKKNISLFEYDRSETLAFLSVLHRHIRELEEYKKQGRVVQA